jgi:hypothetical protein
MSLDPLEVGIAVLFLELLEHDGFDGLLHSIRDFRPIGVGLFVPPNLRQFLSDWFEVHRQLSSTTMLARAGCGVTIVDLGFA